MIFLRDLNIKIASYQRQVQEVNESVQSSSSSSFRSLPTATPLARSFLPTHVPHAPYSGSAAVIPEISPSVNSASLSQHTISSEETPHGQLANTLDTTPPYLRAQMQAQRTQEYLNELMARGSQQEDPRVRDYLTRAINRSKESSTESILQDVRDLHRREMEELDATIRDLDREQSRISQMVPPRPPIRPVASYTPVVSYMPRPLAQNSPLDLSARSQPEPRMAIPPRPAELDEEMERETLLFAERQLEEQLREAERRKAEIAERDRQHQEEIQRLQAQWAREKEAAMRMEHLLDQDALGSVEVRQRLDLEPVTSPASRGDHPSIDRDVKTAVSMIEKDDSMERSDVGLALNPDPSGYQLDSNRLSTITEGSTIKSDDMQPLEVSMEEEAADDSKAEQTAEASIQGGSGSFQDLPVSSSVDFYEGGFKPLDQGVVIEHKDAEVSSGAFATPEKQDKSAERSTDAVRPTWFDILRESSSDTSHAESLPAGAVPATVTPGSLFRKMEAQDLHTQTLHALRAETPSPFNKDTTDNSSQRWSTPKSAEKPSESFNANNNNCINSSNGSSHPLHFSSTSCSDDQPLYEMKPREPAMGKMRPTEFCSKKEIMDQIRKITERIDHQEELLDVLRRLDQEGASMEEADKEELHRLVSERVCAHILHWGSVSLGISVTIQYLLQIIKILCVMIFITNLTPLKNCHMAEETLRGKGWGLVIAPLGSDVSIV